MNSREVFSGVVFGPRARGLEFWVLRVLWAVCFSTGVLGLGVCVFVLMNAVLLEVCGGKLLILKGDFWY